MPQAPRRIAAVALHRLRVGIARSAAPDDDAPLAVVVARPHGSVRDETSLLGNTRLDEVSREAWELGVRPGATIAAARARVADLAVRVVSSSAVDAALARLAEAALAFGATVAFSSEEDLVWVDVTGCAHLFASSQDPVGEATLARRLTELAQRLGHTPRVAVADGPRLAAAFARHAPYPPGDAFAPVIVPSGVDASRAAIATLPIRALPLGDDDRAWLVKLGVRRVADLHALPHDALGTRLGGAGRARRSRGAGHTIRVSRANANANAKGDGDGGDAIALARGEDRAPLTPYVPPASPEERVDLEYGVEATAALLFVARTLADRMAARLEGRALATTRLSLLFELDRALLLPEEPREARALHLTLAAPMQRGGEIFAILRARLESSSAPTLPAPVRAVILRAGDLVAPQAAPLDLFVPEARAERALPRLYEELTAELGAGRVGILTLKSAYRPEARAVLAPYVARARAAEMESSRDDPSRGGARPAQAARTRRSERGERGERGGRGGRATPLVSRGVEPTRMLPVAVPFLAPREGVEQCIFLARYEAVEWWRGEHGARSSAPAIDVLAVWLEDEQAMAWVEVDRATGVAVVRGWLE